jgi:predicted  nucleic acid-binding Zn-ribbon protein
VSGTTNAPADNATVGATFGVDIEDGSGNTVTFTTVQNSVLAQEILQVEVESGDVLDLETGLDVDIQNLGDVAIFVSDNSAFLSGRVDAVNTSLTNLESTIVDLTSGVADIFVSPTEPVAGVGGVPDPIPDFSRWYDSDDDNEPYYWTGSAWVSLADPRIAANAASITSLQSSLNTTNSNLSAVQVVADSKIVALFQDSEPSTSGRTTGDLWFDTNDGNKAYRFNGTAWVLARDAGIQTAINNAATAQSTADGKIVTFVQDNPPTASAVGDLWIDSNDNNKLYRWNGSAWVSIRDAGIDANATAISTLDTTVTTLEGEVAVISGSDTTLVSELKKRTKIQDETDDNLETETDEDVETETIDSVTVGLATADQTLQTLVTESRENLASQANDIVALDASIFELETETTANASAVSNLEVRVTSAEGSITSNATDITTLQSDLATTDNTLTGTSTALTALTTRVTANEGSITSQSSDITSLQSSLTSVTDSATANSTAISALDTRVTSAEGTITSQSSDITSLQSDLTTAEGDITTNASAVSALDTRVTSAEGTITSQSSDITSLQSSLTTTNTNVTSNATAITGLDTRVTSAEGSITSQASDITSLQSSLTTANTNITGNATAISGIDTRVTSAEGSITSISTDITTLQTSVGDNSTSITTQATSINGLEAQYTVKIDNNGRIAGYGLASTAGDSTPTSEFVVIADKFSVVNPSSTVDNPIIPFQISNNKILMTSDVEVNGNLMTGTISADRIDIDNVTLDTSSGQLIIANGGVDTAQIGTNAVTQVVQDLNSGNQQFSGNSSTRIFRQIADVTLSATGATVQLGGKFMARSHNDQCLCQFRIKRGSTVLFTSQTFSVRPSPEGIHVPIGFIDTAGTTGSVTYTLEAGLNDEFQNYSDAFLFALETKR